ALTLGDLQLRGRIAQRPLLSDIPRVHREVLVLRIGVPQISGGLYRRGAHIPISSARVDPEKRLLDVIRDVPGAGPSRLHYVGVPGGHLHRVFALLFDDALARHQRGDLEEVRTFGTVDGIQSRFGQPDV